MSSWVDAFKEFWSKSVLGELTDAGTLPSAVVADNRRATMYGIHSMLKYHEYDPSNGLFYNENSIGFCLEVLPQIGADDDMVARLGSMFNNIPPNCGLQWMLFGNPLLDDLYDKYVLLRELAVDQGASDPFFIDLAKRRAEYAQKNKGQPLFPHDNFSIKRTRLVLSLTRQGIPDDKKLVSKMVALSEMMKATLHSASFASMSLDATGLIKFLWPILNPESMFSTERIHDIEYDDGRSLKDQVTELGHYARVTTDGVLFGYPPESVDAPDHRIMARSFGIQQYPKNRELWEMSSLVGSFFDDTLQYPCPYLICGGVYTLDINETSNKALLKNARAKQNAESKMAPFQPELALQAQDWNSVVYQLDAGGALCELYHNLVLFAPIDSMPSAAQTATNIWRSERFAIRPLQTLHLACLYASLPMTLTTECRNDLKLFRIMSTKTTTNAIDMAPIISEWAGVGDPVMLFFGRRGTPTFLDFYSNPQGNYNVFIAGVSGAGKSVAMNEILSAYRGTGAQARVIDVGRSYRNLTALQGGTFIDFTPTSDICLNPFSWITGAENFLDEMKMLRPMIGKMAAPNESLTDYQYSLLSEAITAAWNDYGQDANPTRVAEMLRNIKNENDQPDRIAFELSKQLQPFCEGGVYGHYFNGRANLNLDHDMVCLELEELKSTPDLRAIILFALTSKIASDMYLSRDRKKICLLDEAWQLLGDNKETAEFIEEGYRRARKYRGIFCLGTQGIEDAFKNAAAQAAYNNADWKIFLRQDKKNLEQLIAAGKVSFSPIVKAQLMSLRTERGRFSEMLISSPNGEAVVRHIPDPYSLMVASTNAEDYVAVERLLEQGYSTSDALGILMKQRGIQ